MNKPLTFLIAYFLTSTTTFSQEKAAPQLPTFSVHFILNDFQSAMHVRSTSLSKSLRDGKFGKVKDMSPGLSLNYLQGLSRTFDLSAGISGSFLDYPFQDSILSGEKNLLLEGDIAIRGKMLDNSHLISPYVEKTV